jgi:RNA polymerase sigma factor (sigma-70 family)
LRIILRDLTPAADPFTRCAMADPVHEIARIDDLLVRARAGDAAAEASLFRHVHARILALAKKRIWDAEAARDIAQETLRTAFEKYRDAELPRGFYPWLFTILHHKVGNYLKRRRSELQHIEPGDVHLLRGWEALVVSPDGEIAYVELVDALEKALRRVSGDCRKIFRLLVSGAGRQEICDAFAGEPIGTIDSRISRCRARLLAGLEELQKTRKPA